MWGVKCCNCEEYRNNWCEKVHYPPLPHMISDCQYFRRKGMPDFDTEEEAIEAWKDGKEQSRMAEFIVRETDFPLAVKQEVVGELVRCKDCIHHHYEKGEIPYCDRIDYGYGWKDNDFCSRAERREE